jgi:hypothetical protein
MPDTSLSHLFTACCSTPFPPQTPFSPPSLVLLQNQSYKHVGWIWPRGVWRWGSHHITSHLRHESYIQMYSVCSILFRPKKEPFSYAFHTQGKTATSTKFLPCSYYLSTFMPNCRGYCKVLKLPEAFLAFFGKIPKKRIQPFQFPALCKRGTLQQNSFTIVLKLPRNVPFAILTLTRDVYQALTQVGQKRRLQAN